MPYLKFLQALIALGPRLPAIFAALQALVDAIANAFPPPEGVLAITHATTLEGVVIEGEVLDAECEVANLVAGPNAAFDGSRLRGVFKFLQDSGLLDAFVTYFLARAGGLQ